MYIGQIFLIQMKYRLQNMYNVERAASVVAAFYSILLGYGSLKKKSLKGIFIAKTFFFLITNNVEEGGGEE